MFGGIHIEKALWTVLGRILNSSGGTEILTETEIAGTIDSFLKSSQKTRTWHVHKCIDTLPDAKECFLM